MQVSTRTWRSIVEVNKYCPYENTALKEVIRVLFRFTETIQYEGIAAN